MATYRELQALPPEAYLTPSLFVTEFDSLHRSGTYAGKQYQHGLDIGHTATYISIAVNSTWSASMKDGGHLSAYEGIGYHACTADLLRGFLDSGCRVVVHRLTPDTITSTVIK